VAPIRHTFPTGCASAASGADPSQRGQQEAAAVHAGMVGRVVDQVKDVRASWLASSSTSSRLTILAPQSHAIQTTSPSRRRPGRRSAGGP